MSLDGIHIARWGAGRPVVMVHGGSQGGPSGGEHLWKGQRPLAEDGWELVLPDRPGHGQSPSRGPEDLELDAVWLDELLGDGAHVVAHSYGGAVALCAAGRRPDAFRSLTLIEAPIFTAAAHRPEAQEYQARIERVGNTKNRYLALARLLRTVNVPMKLMEPRPNLGHLRAMARHFQTIRSPETWDATSALDAVASARVPVLAVDGGWSPGFEAICDELATWTGGERLSIDAGHHFPQLAGEPPGAAFNDALGRFMTAAEQRPRRAAVS